MKLAIALCAYILLGVSLARPDEKYTDRYDNVNVDEILENKKLFVPYIKCVLDQGKCAPDGKELRDNLQDAIENECAKCTDTQKTESRKVIKHLITKEKEYWNEIIAKYDPERKHTAAYEAEFKV